MEETHKDEKQLLLRLKQHFQQAFSQLNRLVEAYLTSKNSKQRALQLNQIEKHLEMQLSPFKDENSHPFFCGKELAPAKGSRKINAYTCQECRQEFNSIVCEECFDVSKHEGHNYKRVQLASGSCDCGCRSKWSEEGFCQAHQYIDEKIEEMAKRQDFRIKLHYFCKMLHVISSFTKQLKAQQLTILKPVDELCASFIEQLNELSRRDKAVNQTTSNLLSQKCSLPQGEVQIKEVLLSFTKLQKTAEKSVQLFNTLFVLSESLQTEIADIYLSRPNDFLSNPYRNLKHIIFANGLLGEDKWLSGKVFDLSKTSKDQSFVQQVKQAYSEQYLKINIINNLHHDSSSIHWANFYQNGKFNRVGDYCTFLKTEEHHMQLNQSHYDIEQIFIGQMIRTIDIIRQQDFFPKICFDLFQKITKKPQKAPIANNLLFTYERLWAVCTYVLIVQKNGNFEASFESFLHITLRLDSSYALLDKFIILFDKILKYMQASNIRPVVHLKQHTSFVNVYYNNYGYFDRNGVLLASIDAIFFKIVVRMLSYLSPKGCITINHKINQYIQIVFVKAFNNIDNTSITNKFLCLTNFIQKLHECLYSQYSDLFLATKFQAFRTKEYYINRHKNYLRNMLTSLHVDTIDAKTFDQLFKHFFFDAPQAFISFKKQMAEHERFIPSKAKGRNINILFLSSLVGKRSPHTQKYYIQDNIPFEAKTYPDQKYSQSLPYHLLQSQAFRNINEIFQRLLDKLMKEHTKLIFRTMRYLAAYPQIQSPQKKQIQKFIEAQEIHVFKTKQYNGHQKALLGGFIALLNPKQDEENQFKRYQEEEQGQSDQRLRQQQAVGNNYNNNDTPSINPRLQLKKSEQKQQSGLSSQKESVPNSEQDTQLKIQCSKCNKSIENIVLPCFISFKRVPSVFDILPDQKCEIFTSCQHFFHQHLDCLPKVDANGIKCCPICSRRFNFLLILPETFNESDEQKYNRINMMIDTHIQDSKKPDDKQQNKQQKRQQQKRKQQKRQWYFRALKSIVWFFLMISMATKTQKDDFYAYKVLGKMLQLYFSFGKTHKQKEYFLSKMLQTKEDSKHKDLIKYLTCIVGEILLPHEAENFKTEREKITLFLSAKQSSNIKKAIRQCLDFNCNLPIDSFIQSQKIHLFELPQNLKLLTQKYKGKCESCNGNLKISFVICLHPLHQSEQMLEKACVSCIDPFITQHIRIIEPNKRTEKYVRHEQQMLTITSDTGDITYFARINKKIWTMQLGSVYQDENLNNLTLGQAINADKIPNRGTFILKKEKYEEIALNFYMRRYLGSSNLQIFLNQ